jgi:hypothetical protein
MYYVFPIPGFSHFPSWGQLGGMGACSYAAPAQSMCLGLPRVRPILSKSAPAHSHTRHSCWLLLLLVGPVMLCERTLGRRRPPGVPMPMCFLRCELCSSTCVLHAAY